MPTAGGGDKPRLAIRKKALVGVETTLADLQSAIQGQKDCENAITFDSAVTGAVRDPALAALIQSWPSLPPAIRAAILALVNASK